MTSLYTIKRRVHKLIATVFGLGYAPTAPGTMGSLAGLVLCLALHDYHTIYKITFFCLFIVGVISSAKVEKYLRKKDPKVVVIDEFACIFIAFWHIPISSASIIVGFLLYRIFDISKIPPLKQLENIGGGWGIMLDDLGAGIYTNLALHALISIGLFGKV